MAAGGTDADGRAFFQQLGGGSTTSAVIELILDSGSFTEHEIGDSGLPVVGDRARYDVTDTSLTYRAADWVHVYSWTVAADTLQLHTEQPCGSLGFYGTTIYASFPFHRGPAPKPGAVSPVPMSSAVAGIPDGRWVTDPLAVSDVQQRIDAAGYDGKGEVDGFGATGASTIRFVVDIDGGILRMGALIDDRPYLALTNGATVTFPAAGVLHLHDSISSSDSRYQLDGDRLTLPFQPDTDTNQDAGELGAATGLFDSAPFSLQR